MINILKYNNIVIKTALCAMGLAGSFSASFPAMANVKPSGPDMMSVNQRYNPAYDPAGMRLGDFVLHSGLSAGGEYTDNVYATTRNAVSDYLYIVRPDLDLRSDFARHEIALTLSGEKGLFHDEKAENYTDYSAILNGRVDVTGQTSLPLMASYVQEHYRRGSPDERGGSEPTVYKLFESTAGLIHRGQTLMMKIIGGVKDYAFNNTRAASGFIDNSDQDRTEWSLYSSIGIQDKAVFAPFVYSDISKINYDRTFSNTGLQRSSSGYELGGGSVINFSDITRASLSAGYITRDFDDPSFSQSTGMAYAMDVIWEPSTLASFQLEASRTIEETAVNNSAASMSSNASLTMTYELFPNLILRPSVGYSQYDYEGIDRTIDAYNAGLSMDYKVSQNVWLSTSYRYITQDDNGRDAGFNTYDANTYTLSLKLQF